MDVKFKYVTATSPEARKAMADKIVHTYLESGSMNELNLPTAARKGIYSMLHSHINCHRLAAHRSWSFKSHGTKDD